MVILMIPNFHIHIHEHPVATPVPVPTAGVLIRRMRRRPAMLPARRTPWEHIHKPKRLFPVRRSIERALHVLHLCDRLLVGLAVLLEGANTAPDFGATESCEESSRLDDADVHDGWIQFLTSTIQSNNRVPDVTNTY